MQGKLIVFEGIEGCGKTTQLQRLQQWLTQLIPECRVVMTREPGGTALGQSLRHILLAPAGKTSQALDIHPSTELLLYAADRAQHVATQLIPELKSGSIVLCDRFTDSTVAYQGFGRGLDRSTIDNLNQIATGGLQSDLTLWLDLAVEQGLARAKGRGQADRMERSSAVFHQRVREGFVALAAEYPDRIVRIDASSSVDQVACAIQAALKPYIDRWQLSAPARRQSYRLESKST
ncbi:MAG: dTMP kinase [Elainellaceae cyanobacterium]